MSHKQPLSNLLSGYQPQPGQRYYQKMARAPWSQPERRASQHSPRLVRYGWRFALGILLVLALLSLSIPAVRASLSAWLGLSVAPSNQMPAQAVTLIAIPSPTPTAAQAPTELPPTTSPAPAKTSAPTPTQPAAVAELVPQVSWAILTPSQIPAGYQLQSAYYDANHQMVIITYLVTRPLPGAGDPTLTASKTITLLQAQKNDFVPMQIAPNTPVEDIRVNDQPAAYALGAWDSEFVKDDKDPQGGQMVSRWRNDIPVQNVYWQVGSIYLEIVTDDPAVSKQDLIDMAASIHGS